ncbi:hypothetical protein A2U01_0085271, partial [Trifolium medium]|nr:hypothetical protein [Trifolium medium]
GKAIGTEGSVSVKAGKKVKNLVRYSRPRPPTELFPSSDKDKRGLKRKEISSDSDIEVDATAVATASIKKKTTVKRKTFQEVPSVP